MQLCGMTSDVPALARNLFDKSMKLSRRQQPRCNAIQLYFVMFDVLLPVAFHLRSTSVSIQMRWLFSQCFTGAETRPSGNAGYNHPIHKPTPASSRLLARVIGAH